MNYDDMCWECSGILRKVRITETYDEPVLGSITIANIPILRCHSCGSEAYFSEGCAYIDDIIEKEYAKRGLERKYRRSQKWELPPYDEQGKETPIE
jgi:YgiT-type zinc finger domain-containing protein